MDDRGALILDKTMLNERNALREQVSELMTKSATLEEGMEKVQAMLQREDRNWLNLFDSSGDDEGFNLDQLKEWSKKLRPSVVAAPWVGRGYRARTNFIWQGGINHRNIPSESRGKGVNVQAFIDDAHNQRTFFGPQAHRRREGCLYHDGVAFWRGNDTTKRLDAIPLNEITHELRDPDNRSTIIAYRRAWNRVDLKTGKKTAQIEWYFVDNFTDMRVPKIKHGTKDEPVSQTHTMFDMHANTMEGFAYGSPDALAAWVWNAIARDAYMDGITMTSAMATFAFKASVTTKQGADGASMKLAQPNGSGATAVVGATNDLVPMSSAGKAYQFEELRGLTAIIATSLDISNIALTSDPGAAGSSYGSASTLDLPTRLAMEARRLEHIELDLRVLRWAGAKEPEVYFDSLEDASEVFREVQALLLLWSSGMYKPEPLEKRLSALLQIAENTVPDGILLPNNEASLARNDIDADGVGEPNATPAGQGQNSAAGKGPGANDLRDDGVGEMMKRLQGFMAAEAALQDKRDEA